MKAISNPPGASDRIATLEEVSQVIDLLGSITTDAGLLHNSILEFSSPLAGRKALADSDNLWIDIYAEDIRAGRLDASPESLAELFADPNGLAN